ncbi:hypothetical protein AB3S75_011649 [Citrus x aurantiifolia]
MEIWALCWFFLGSCYRMVFNLNLPSLANFNFQTHLVVTGLLPGTSLLTCTGHFCSVLLATIQMILSFELPICLNPTSQIQQQ